MAESDKDSISVPLPWGGNIIANGFNVVMLLALAAIGWFMNDLATKIDIRDTEYRRQQRMEHQDIVDYLEYNGCLNRLTIFIARLPREQAVDWYSVPPDLAKCAPVFLVPKKG